jgi:ABC-2 type transport system permease protein
MDKIRRIVHHEIVKHLRQRSFVIATLAIPMISLLIVLLITFLNGNQAMPQSHELLADVGLIPDVAGMDDGSVVIGYVDHADLITEVPEFLPPELFKPFESEAAALAAVESGAIQAYYVIAADYMETGEITRFAPEVQGLNLDSTMFASLIRTNLLPEEDEILTQRLDYILDIETVRLDAEGVPVAERETDDDAQNESTSTPDDEEDTASLPDVWEQAEGARDEDDPMRFIASFAIAMLLYMTIFSAAGLLLNSVIEEKENRTLEILLTSVRPDELLAGKVLGLGTLGLGQSLIWFGTGRLVIGISSDGFGTTLLQSLHLPAFTWLLLLIYFLLGYLIYASLMAGIGAVVSSTREASSLTLLVAAPFMVPLLLLGPLTERPDSILSTILSVFPLTAPVTMMMRVVLTDVTTWQISLSLILMAGSVLLCIWLAARMFRISTLMTGKRPNPIELWRVLTSS